MDFDIVNWHRRTVPSEMCKNCRAIYVLPFVDEAGKAPVLPSEELRWQYVNGELTCGVCEEEIHEDDWEWFVEHRPADADENLSELAAVAGLLPPHTSVTEMDIEPLSLVFRAIHAAKWFIHFTTFSVDTTFLGVLKAASHKVRVRGLVGNLSPFVRESLEAMDAFNHRQYESPFLILGDTVDNPRIDAIHTKLLIIDGVLAIKGSANLNVNAYKKAGKKFATEAIEAVSSPVQVARLNNSYFARHWGRHTPEIWNPVPF